MSLPSGIYNISYEQDMAVVRTRTQWVLLLLLFAALLAFPFFAGNYWTYLFNYVAITIIAALGLQLMLGYCGQVSMAHAAFMAVGGYASAIMVSQAHVPFLVALPLSGVIAGLVGMVFAVPAARVKGWYLALATMAGQFIIMWVIAHNIFKRLFTTGGYESLMVPSASIAGISLRSGFRMYFLVLLVMVVMVYIAKRLTMAKVGRAWVAIRDNEVAARAMGVNVFRYKVLAFFVGCFYAGIAGSLWVHYTGIASVEHYTFTESIWFFGIVTIGGMGSITGAIFGSVVIRMLWEFAFRFGSWLGTVNPSLAAAAAATPLLVVGLVFMLALIFEPRGLAHRWQMIKRSYRLWPYSY